MQDGSIDAMVLGIDRDPIHPRSFSAPFWEATREKRLLVQYCRESGRFQFFPRPVSIATGRDTLEWREIDGRGEIYSLTETHLGLKGFKGHEPYTVILARMDAGIDVIANFVAREGELPVIGMRIKPYWMPLGDGRHLLMFQPEEDRAA